MKTILIPSDFSIQSLDRIKSLSEKFENERLNIVLVHVFLMSDSITELMMLSRRRKEYDYISDEFMLQCKQLEWECWPQINSIRAECFYGSTVAIFKNYLEGNHIDLIAYPETYTFKKLTKRSFDPSRLIAKCGRQVLVLTGTKQKKESDQKVQSVSYSHLLN